MEKFLTVFIVGYLLGSIPFGYLIPKAKGIDITMVGSKATSATNVSRALGWRWGIVVIVGDVLKGIGAALYALAILPLSPWAINLSLVAPILGHNFPAWLRFKGGRGAATAYGVLIAFLKWKIFFVFAPWVFILLATRTMSLANIVFALSLPFVFCSISFSLSYFTGGLLISGAMMWAFRDNIKRLKKGKEPKVSFKW